MFLLFFLVLRLGGQNCTEQNGDAVVEYMVDFVMNYYPFVNSADYENSTNCPEMIYTQASNQDRDVSYMCNSTIYSAFSEARAEQLYNGMQQMPDVPLALQDRGTLVVDVCNATCDCKCNPCACGNCPAPTVTPIMSPFVPYSSKLSPLTFSLIICFVVIIVFLCGYIWWIRHRKFHNDEILRAITNRELKISRSSIRGKKLSVFATYESASVRLSTENVSVMWQDPVMDHDLYTKCRSRGDDYITSEEKQKAWENRESI